MPLLILRFGRRVSPFLVILPAIGFARGFAKNHVSGYPPPYAAAFILKALTLQINTLFSPSLLRRAARPLLGQVSPRMFDNDIFDDVMTDSPALLYQSS